MCIAVCLYDDDCVVATARQNVIGTLVDQLTYPDTTGGEELSRAEVADLLAAVDLDYLLDREDALTNSEIVWEDELSLGEKQRLAIARLVHHRP